MPSGAGHDATYKQYSRQSVLTLCQMGRNISQVWFCNIELVYDDIDFCMKEIRVRIRKSN